MINKIFGFFLLLMFSTASIAVPGYSGAKSIVVKGNAINQPTPPGLNNQDNYPPGLKKQGKTPAGWSKGQKKGWQQQKQPNVKGWQNKPNTD